MTDNDRKTPDHAPAGLRQAPAEAEAAFLAMVRALRAIRTSGTSGAIIERRARPSTPA